MTPGDEERAADEEWLRHQIIALLQRQIAPGTIGDWTQIYVMQRARRLLRRMGVKPDTESTAFERRAARAIVGVPLLRLVMEEPTPAEPRRAGADLRHTSSATLNGEVATEAVASRLRESD